MSLLEIKEITKSYGSVRALKNVSLQISEGDIYGLLGPNGAGKSTLINILSGLIKPDNGSVFLEDKTIKGNEEEYKGKIGVVPQEISLYQELSGYQNLMFWGGLYNMGTTELKERVNNLLNVFHLQDKRNSKVKTYSGGMKRKINIACSILHNPTLLLLDEPTVGLDPQSRLDILDFIENLNARGVTIIYTTHYMEVAERLCNKIAIIDEGNILAKGDLSELRVLSGAKDSINIKLRSLEFLPLNAQTLGELHFETKQNSNTISVKCDNINEQISGVLNEIRNYGGEIISVETNVTNLESIFMELTGKTLER